MQIRFAILALLVALALPLGASAATEITVNAYMTDNLSVSGSISKGSGTFVIDHPLDPANKLLFHSFVESPDVKNLYDGLATLDSKGVAVVQLPAYFDALNRDVRYQVKPVGQSMPDLYIKEEEKNNQFTIGGGAAGGEVSWQITGTRHDPYIVAHPIITEVEKGPNQVVNKGEYLFKGYPTRTGGYDWQGPVSALVALLVVCYVWRKWRSRK